jgi:N-methylhydantoinase A/oxoprolinase/acetone carboxylase beta subunit
MKLLLLAALTVFSAYGFMLAADWKNARESALDTQLTANTVGVLAGVPENDTNRIAMQLAQKERELTVREEQLVQAETTADTRTLMLISLVGVGLLGLILLNFYLDMRRRHSLA